MNYENFKEELKVITTTEDFDRVINAHRDEIIAAAEAANFVDKSSYDKIEIAVDIAYRSMHQISAMKCRESASMILLGTVMIYTISRTIEMISCTRYLIFSMKSLLNKHNTLVTSRCIG